jgi:hypothetical protein
MTKPDMCSLDTILGLCVSTPEHVLSNSAAAGNVPGKLARVA